MNPNVAVLLTTIPINLPSIPVYIPAPVTYQFQVIEYVTDDKIVKVELQVQSTTHKADGSIDRISGFTAIPRIQMPFVEYAK